MMKARPTYVPSALADEFGDYIVTRDEEMLGAVRARTRDYSMLSFLKMLYALRDGPTTFSDLYARSQIRMKKSFLSYVRLFLDYGYAQKAQSGVYVMYSLTPKGQTILTLLHKDN